MGDDEAEEETGQTKEAWQWRLPEGVEPPPVPEDNPMTPAKVDLGRHLFYDVRLSKEENRSCGVCHEQAKSFTDGFPRAVGTHGDVHPRHSPSLLNVAYFSFLTWVNPNAGALEEQLLAPLMGHQPIVEMGMDESTLIQRLKSPEYFPDYPKLFLQAFPNEEEPLTIENLAKALAAFERTILSWNSDYDRTQRGEAELSAEASRGEQLFFGKARCFRCHSGKQFASPADEKGQVLATHGYYDVGLYDLHQSAENLPEGYLGLAEQTGMEEDRGKFRTPSLRNVALTGPYMHDGSVEFLSEAIRFMAEGGRNIRTGPYAGDGRESPNKDPLMEDLGLTADELGDLESFLESLSDFEVLDESRLANPFPMDEVEVPSGFESSG